MKYLQIFTTTLTLALYIGLVTPVPVKAACNNLADAVGNGNDLTEGDSTGGPTGLGFDVGSGICNSSWTRIEDSGFPSAGAGPGASPGIELGMQGIHRFNPAVVPRTGTNQDTYVVDTGFLNPPSSGGSKWGFRHSIAYDGNISMDLDALTFFIRTDDGTSIPADFGTGSGIYDMRALRTIGSPGFLDNRHFTTTQVPTDNPTPEWNDLYQTSQAPAFTTFGWLLNSTETALYDVIEEGAWTMTLATVEDGALANVSICVQTTNSTSCNPPPVVYTCSPFATPIPDNGSVIALKKKQSRLLPLKTVCTDSAGNVLTAGDIPPPVVQASFNDGGDGVPVDGEDIVSAGKETDGNEFVPTDGFWMFNFSTKPHTATGSYTVTMKEGAGGGSILMNSPSTTFTRP